MRFSGPHFSTFEPEKLRIRTLFTQCYSCEHQAYSELYETPKMDIFTKIVNGSLLEAVD